MACVCERGAPVGPKMRATRLLLILVALSRPAFAQIAPQRVQVPYAGTSKMPPSGGNVITIECGWPMDGTGSVVTTTLPTFEPP